MNFNHVSVLLDECIEGLNIRPDGIYVDCTAGGGGHSAEILKRLSDKGLLVCIDKDEEALNVAKRASLPAMFGLRTATSSRLPKCWQTWALTRLTVYLPTLA